VSYQPTTGEFFMTEEQAFCLADPNGPNFSAVFLIGLGYLRAEPRITEAFRTGAGLGSSGGVSGTSRGSGPRGSSGSPGPGRRGDGWGVSARVDSVCIVYRWATNQTLCHASARSDALSP